MQYDFRENNLRRYYKNMTKFRSFEGRSICIYFIGKKQQFLTRNKYKAPHHFDIGASENNVFGGR